MKKVYTIRKVVICDSTNEYCGELYPYQLSIIPDCKECEFWKNKSKDL